MCFLTYRPEPAPELNVGKLPANCPCKLASEQGQNPFCPCSEERALSERAALKGRRVTVAKARAPRSFFKEGATLHPATMRLAAVLVVATFCASVVAAKNDFLGAWTPLERAARPPQRALRSPTVSSLTAGVPSAVRRAR